MLYTVVVYHNETPRSQDHDHPAGGPCGRFWNFCGACSLSWVGTFHDIEASTEDEALDKAWQRGQNDFGQNFPETRSMSVGDVIYIPETRHAWTVSKVGFTAAHRDDMEKAARRHKYPYAF